MRKNLKIILPVIVATFLSACAEGPVSQMESSRAETASLLFFNDPVNDGPMIDQVTALSQSADQLVQSSKVNGALIGAAVGCGVTILTGSTARNCVTRAAVTGAGGAVLGQIAGEQDVARRVELVSADDVARNLIAARSQFESIQSALPQLLALQEAELNRLMVQLINGEIEQADYDIAVGQIERDRAELSNLLSLSARDARRASRNLQEAARRGQTSLDWHINAATTLADDVESSRSSFSMNIL